MSGHDDKVVVTVANPLYTATKLDMVSLGRSDDPPESSTIDLRFHMHLFPNIFVANWFFLPLSLSGVLCHVE